MNFRHPYCAQEHIHPGTRHTLVTCFIGDLDEPTNHMDIPSREALEEAIQNFDGTVIAASHDRYFLKQIATRVVYVGENAARGLEEDLAEGEALQAEAQRIRGADDGADNGEQAPGGNGKGSKKKGKKQKQKGGKR